MCIYFIVGINRIIFYGVSIKDEMCYSFLIYFFYQRLYIQFCMIFKDIQVCKRYFLCFQGVYDDCFWSVFINGKDMIVVEMMKWVVMECGKMELCLVLCFDVLDVMLKYLCMYGEIYGYVFEKWLLMKQVRVYRKMCMNFLDVFNFLFVGVKVEDSKSGSVYLLNNYLVVIFVVMFFLCCIVV